MKIIRKLFLQAIGRWVFDTENECMDLMVPFRRAPVCTVWDCGFFSVWNRRMDSTVRGHVDLEKKLSWECRQRIALKVALAAAAER